MKQILKIILVLCFQGLAVAQNPEYIDYTWTEKPDYKISEEVADHDIISIKHAILNEFYFDDESNLLEYNLIHKVIWLNSDEKIEEYNKVYIPTTLNSVIKVNKARVVKLNGEVIELNDSDILKAKDEETGLDYTYFAFEGIEKGSFIEYFYVIEKEPQFKGKRVNIQSTYLKKNVDFDLYAPKNLVFDFKAYNGLPEVEKQDDETEKLHWKLHLNDIIGLEEEDSSAYSSVVGFLIYKLEENLANNRTSISSYSGIINNLYKIYYKELTKKEDSNLKKFAKEAFNKNQDEESQIRALEIYLKSNVFKAKQSGGKFSDLNSIMQSKVASEFGLMKLYVALLRHINVKHEIVITSNRKDLKFDSEFESQNFLTDFLIYFPKYKTYLEPLNYSTRYGYPDAYLTDNYGLFIKEVKVGDYKSSIGKIKYIKSLDADKTVDQMQIDVTFDSDDISKNTILYNRKMSGYYAMFVQPFTNIIKEDDRKELLESFAKDLNEDADVLRTSMKNGEPELFGIKPLEMEVEFNTNAFVEKAGNKYLFKVGELIGKQVELYQDKTRVLVYEQEYKRTFKRVITITIPDGYKISNLNDIVIDNAYSNNGKTLFLFKSSYNLKGNILTVHADEFYEENFISKDIYQEYRKVINSAADFNKVILILEPSNK